MKIKIWENDKPLCVGYVNWVCERNKKKCKFFYNCNHAIFDTKDMWNVIEELYVEGEEWEGWEGSLTKEEFKKQLLTRIIEWKLIGKR